MAQDRFRCNSCRVTVAVRRKGVVQIVSPAIAQAVSLASVTVLCGKCGAKRRIEVR